MTSTEKVDLRGAAATLLFTLYLRRRDARSARPILGDPYAEPVYDRITHDVRALPLLAGNGAAIVCRARQLDTWTRRFLAAEPHGQVLHLGCGLDSRPLRLELPPSVRWVDVDQPEVMEIRRRLYAFPAHVEQVAGSITDDGWWNAVDPDRPTLTVAEGLFMYVPADDVHATVDRVTTRLPRGEIAFDAVAPWTVPVSRRSQALVGVDARFRWSWDPAGFAHRHPTLHELDDLSVYDEAAVREPRLWLRPVLSAVGHVPALQDAMRLHRFGFGTGPGRAR